MGAEGSNFRTTAMNLAMNLAMNPTVNLAMNPG